MIQTSLLLVMLLGQSAPDSGYVTVNSNMPGLAVYLEGDYIGRTPIKLHPVIPGSYNLTIVSNDSLDALYARFRSGPLGQKLSSVWTLAAVDAGTFQLEVKPRAQIEAFIDYGKVLAAPGKAKWLAGCGVGSFFLVSVAIGILIGHLAF